MAIGKPIVVCLIKNERRPNTHDYVMRPICDDPTAALIAMSFLQFSTRYYHVVIILLHKVPSHQSQEESRGGA